jgi:tetratricopeptide (TPR) repeat protein
VNALLNALRDKVQDDPSDVIRQLGPFLDQAPFDADAYRLLAAALDELERRSGARGHVRTNVGPGASRYEDAISALSASDFHTAGTILRKRLMERPRDVEALSLMAELASTLNYDAEAEALLRLVLELSPDFSPARVELARMLDAQDRPFESRKELEQVLAREPENVIARAVYASSLGRTGRYDEAAGHYQKLLQELPNESGLWAAYGHILTTLGRAQDGLRALRRAVAVDPENGEGWWAIANTKSARFEPEEIAAMRGLLERGTLTSASRAHIHFALGKAYEDAGDAAEAFAHYERGNAIRRQSDPYDPSLTTSYVDASMNLFSRTFFEQRIGFGAAARDPIFIVGLPRAGSTLIEQILASHPAVEGTRELLDIPNVAKELGYRRGDYFETVARLDSEQARLFGEKYLDRTRVHRRTDRPLFIDKAPTNWMHVGLIHLLMPNAKIVDARRHPLACGVSNFRQSYDRGHAFSYDLAMTGHYYSEYVRLMAHWDEALPGVVHRVFHERLVEDTEGEIRRMLDYLDLPFDPACLRFFESDRAVRTPSAEQVRRPINRDHLEHWRMFEPWLDPLKSALGPVLDFYPDVPPQFTALVPPRVEKRA